MYIGITGFIGAGKTDVATILRDKHGFTPRSFGNEVRLEAAAAGIPHERELLQELGDRRRRVYGGEYWAKKILRSMHNGHDYCIEGIRNPEEVILFKKNPQFRLVAVYAPDSQRMRRLLSRGRPGDPKNAEEFRIHDLRDKGLLAGSSFGQNTALTVPQANYTINNSGTPQELEENVNNLISILRRELQ